MTLVINRPCGTCLHAAVCRIRGDLERTLDTSSVPTPPDPAVRFDLTIDATCGHYVKEPDHLTESAPNDASLDSTDDASVANPAPTTSLTEYLAEPFGAEPAVALEPTAEGPWLFEDPEPASEPEPATTPLTVEQRQATGHAPARQVVTKGGGKAKPLGPVMVRCDPGCKGQYVTGPGIAAHRRHCDAYKRHHDAVVRDVEPLPGALGPAPTAADPLEARQAFEDRRRENARKAADAAWRRRHGGEALS